MAPGDFLTLDLGFLIGCVAGTVVHELAHAVVAMFCRVPVIRIRIGTAGPTARIPFGRTSVEVRLGAIGGRTSLIWHQPQPWYEAVLVGGAGALTNAVLGATALVDSLQSLSPLWSGFAIANLATAAGSLWPHRARRGSNRGSPSDGMQMLNAVKARIGRGRWSASWTAAQAHTVGPLLRAASDRAIGDGRQEVAPSDIAFALDALTPEGLLPACGAGWCLLPSNGVPTAHPAPNLPPGHAARALTDAALSLAISDRTALSHLHFARALLDAGALDDALLRRGIPRAVAVADLQDLCAYTRADALALLRITMDPHHDAIAYWDTVSPYMAARWLTARDRAMVLNNAAYFMLLYTPGVADGMARDLAVRALNEWPGNLAILDTTALALAESGDAEEALTMCHELLTDAEIPQVQRATAFAIAALARFKLGDVVGAQEYIAYAAATNPSHPLVQRVSRTVKPRRRALTVSPAQPAVPPHPRAPRPDVP